MKYGEDILKSVVKESIGTGMTVNAEFNSGRPYFITFRPLLHSTKRLTNDELKTYEKYFNIMEDIEYQISALKEEKLDVLDLELELKLARAKIKSGQFQMADMYLESLNPRIEESWKKLGKKPRHIVVKKLQKAEVEKGISEAQKERAKYIKKNPEEKVSFAESLNQIKKLIEEKKKSKDTSKLENKLAELQSRFKGIKEVNSNDAAGAKAEIDEFKKEVEKL